RIARLVRVFGRVVVRDLDVDPGTFRQRDGILEAVAILPGEIPVGDPEQRLHLAVGQSGLHLHVMGEVVRVGAARIGPEVDWQRGGGFDRIVLHAGFDVHAGAYAKDRGELYAHQGALRGLVREV